MTPAIRIGAWDYLRAQVADRLDIDLTASHTGATEDWSPLQTFGHDTRQPIAEIATVPYRVVIDPILGEIVVGPLEQPLIFELVSGGIW